jgi:hypothetical protein
MAVFCWFQSRSAGLALAGTLLPAKDERDSAIECDRDAR